MWKSIHDDVVMRLDESLDDTKSSQPTSWINDEIFAIPEFSQLLLKLTIVLGGPKSKGATGGVDSEVGGGLDGSIPREVVFSQAQIVSRGEIDTVDDVVIVVHCEYFCGGPCQDFSVVEPQFLLMLIHLVLHSIVGPIKNISSLGLEPRGNVGGLHDTVNIDGPLFESRFWVDFDLCRHVMLMLIEEWWLNLI